MRLDITPEDEGDINDSAWYAFVVQPNGAGVANIELRYRGGHHRYVPKVSKDGERWAALDPQQAEHAALLERIAGSSFTILHRIDAHLFEPIPRHAEAAQEDPSG